MFRFIPQRGIACSKFFSRVAAAGTYLPDCPLTLWRYRLCRAA
jgi:hypothetical protein